MEARDIVDIVIFIIIAIGLVWAGIRLWSDFTRPLSDENLETNVDTNNK